MERAIILQKIYDRLANCEVMREQHIMKDKSCGHDNAVIHIEEEIRALRLTLKDIMNSPCPLIKDI